MRDALWRPTVAIRQRRPTVRSQLRPGDGIELHASATATCVTRTYAWIVFALTFGLLISDYMSRQVLNAVFPLLKAEWALSDARLGLLSGIVALMVGLLTFPLSLLADRWGRVRSLTLMAVLWSLATLACGLAKNYRADVPGAALRRHRRGCLRQRRDRRLAERLSCASARHRDRRVHGRRDVRLRAGHGGRRRPRGSTSAGAGRSPAWRSSVWRSLPSIR